MWSVACKSMLKYVEKTDLKSRLFQIPLLKFFYYQSICLTFYFQTFEMMKTSKFTSLFTTMEMDICIGTGRSNYRLMTFTEFR